MHKIYLGSEIMGFVTKNREQMSLIGYSLDDFVEQNAKCRFVVQLVSELNLEAMYSDYSEQGNDAFDPEIMLATWFYGYSEGETSTRKLEQRCQRDLHFIYVSANLRPDHSSLSRFRKRHLNLLTNYFIQIVRLAKEKELAEFKSIAMDGSKIQASASARKSKDSDTLSSYLKAVRKDIAEYMEKCELAENEGADDREEIREKIGHLQRKEKTLLERKAHLAKRKEGIKPEYRERHKINIVEPDALMMDKVNGRKKAPAYNAQISVDTESQLICGNDVVQDRNDHNQFSAQYENVENNLGAEVDREYTTDAGYHSLEQLEYIEENKIKATVVDPYPENRSHTNNVNTVNNPEEILKEKEKFQRADFVFNREGDYYECPAGKKLSFERRYSRSGWRGRTYKAADCRRCSYREKCLPSNNRSGVRRIHRDDREIYAEKMLEKLQSEQSKEKLKIRMTTVEPAFGNIKENLGFRRFRLSGLSQVQGEFNLMCIAHNINKMYILLATILPLLAAYQYLKDQIIVRYKDLLVYLHKNNQMQVIK
jgi:transposase